MSIVEDTNPCALKHLLAEIHDRSTAAPDLQRGLPAAYLERKGVAPDRVLDCVLNWTLIDRTINQMISDRAHSDYLSEICHTSGFPLGEVLSSHCLPTDEDWALRDDYEAFLTWRQAQVWNRIQQVTGVVQAADLKADAEGLA